MLFRSGEKALPSITHFTSCRSQADGTDHRGPLRSQVGDRAPAWSQLSGLTYEIRQQDGEEEGGRDGRQGRAFPAAVLGGLLQLEGLPGERIAGQQAGWWASRESSLLFRLERGLGIVLWVRQEKNALISRGWGLLRGFLELRRPWGFPHENPMVFSK